MLLLLAYFCGLGAAGRYAIAVALCNPIWALVMLGLRAAQVTDARSEYCFADYLAVRVAASGAGLILVAIAALGCGYETEAMVVIVSVAFARLIEGISDVFRGALQQRERMDGISIALFIQGVSGLALMFVVGSLGGGEMLIVASFPVAMLLTLLFWDLPCYARIGDTESSDADSWMGLWRRPLSWSKLARLTVSSIPLAVAGFLIALVPQLPKYVIASAMGDEAVGVYAMIGYWVSLGMMVAAALGNVAAPRLAKYHALGNVRAFVRLLVRLVALVGGMGVAGVALVVLFGSRIAIILGQDNSELPRLAVALSVFATILYITAPLGRALAAMRRFWSQTIAMSLGIVLAMAVLPWAVSVRGLVGAAETMSFSMAVVAVLTAGLVWRELGGPFPREAASPKEAA
jgi:O-antigen/teichoic acid export membrane protein